MTRRSVWPVLVTTLALVIAACGGDAAPATSATIISAVESGSTLPADTTSTSSTTTTTLIPSGPPLIIEGDKNETVAAFQYLLSCTGYGDLTVDGSYGPATKEIVQSAQLALGRVADGAPDELTLAELARACAVPRRIAADEPLTVVGNAAPDDPESFSIALLADSILAMSITPEAGLTLTLRGADGIEVIPEDGEWIINTTQDYTIEVVSDVEPLTFSIEIALTEATPDIGDWIIAADGITYRGTEMSLGDDAQTVIDHIYDYLGHDVRGTYGEFDTGWDDPGQPGFRGILIEGMAFLFYGPSPSSPGTPETFGRVRYVGGGVDADGEDRPEKYVTTFEGITVGDTLADLEAAYGDAAKAGSNSSEHYRRIASGSKELCFYFGSSAPSNTTTIKEIATECRSD